MRLLLVSLMVYECAYCLELRRRSLMFYKIRGGYENEDYFDGNYNIFKPPPPEPVEQSPSPPSTETQSIQETPVKRYEMYEPERIPVYVSSSSGNGGLVTVLMALTATLAGGIVWFIKKQPEAKNSESMYAETVASLEAQLHRLSVDRQMLADEFDQARTSLEQQIATATAAAEASRSETAAALEEANRATRQARAAADALSERLKSEIALAERLREDKLRAETELDRLRRRYQRRARSSISTKPEQTSHIVYENTEISSSGNISSNPTSIAPVHEKEEISPPQMVETQTKPEPVGVSKPSSTEELVAQLRRELESIKKQQGFP
mmetsp:Transcript_11176/g.15378  ORF Transcript_11176/g.15378 Transcript_11176/m.15378 type:complete len:324 (+) Transcript_11176:40-1011(+)